MNVAFGVTLLANGLRGKGVDGIGTYTRELMASMPSTMSLLPYSFGGPHALGDSIGDTKDAGSFGLQALRSLFSGQEFTTLRNAVGFNAHVGEQVNVNLVHATDHLIPKLRSTPVIATIFDAIPLSNPEWMAYRFKKIKNEMWRRTAFWADHIITISEFAKLQIAEHFGLPLERITSIPLGVGAQWFTPAGDADWRHVQRLYNLPEQYFVNVGTLQPRKNIRRLLAAHASLPPNMQMQFPLVIIGRTGWNCDYELSLFRSGCLTHVRWLDHVPDGVVQVVVKRAHALVFPSLMEGFGLPVLEAFAAGVPVIASMTTSIPEVAGDAAILVDPLRIEDIAQGMLSLVDCNDAHAHYVKCGRAQAKAFSWTACANKTSDIYKKYGR